MSNAPERIWAATPADGEMKPETMYGWTTGEHLAEWELDNKAEIELGCDDPLAYVEYTRADLCADPALLAEAVEKFAALEKAASEVSLRGAETGPQWTKLTIALLSARAFIAKWENRHDH